MRQGGGCSSSCHRCSGGNRPLWAGSLSGLWRALTSTNSHGWRSAQQPATRPDVEWCVAEGRRGCVWAAEARGRIDLAVGRAVARAARSVRSAGAIRRGLNNKIKSDVVVANEQQEGNWADRGARLKGGSRVLSEEGQTREGNEPARRTKAARKWHSGDPGRVVPSVTCALRGPLRREKLNGCFFQGRRQEGTSGRCSRRFKVHCPILWARCHTTVRRPSSSGLVERSLRIHPACVGAMAQSDVDVLQLPCWVLFVVVRSASWRIGDSGIFQSRRRRQQCASVWRGLDWYGSPRIRKSTQVMPSRIVSVPGSPNCSVGRSVLGAQCWGDMNRWAA